MQSAAEAAFRLALQPDDPTGGADHYYNPKVVNPGWQNSMTHTGDFGGHTYYSSRAVPADSLSRAIEQAMGLVGPRTAPTPAPASDMYVARTFGSLPRQPGMSPQAMSEIAKLFGQSTNNVTPYLNRSGTGITDPAGIVFGSQMTTSLKPRTVPGQTYAGQDRYTGTLAKAAPIPASVDDRVTARNTQFPPPQRLPALPSSTPDRISQMAELYAGGGPTRPSTGVGKPPTTRTVATIGVQGGGAANTPSANGLSSAGSMPKFGDLLSTFVNKVPSANGTINNSKSQERLAPGSGAMIPGSASGAGNFNPFSQKLPDALDVVVPANVPLPRPRPATPAVYKTETYQVLNPNWKESLPAGTPLHSGSRDTVEQRQAGLAMAAEIPKYLTRTRQVLVTPAKPALDPAAPVPAPAPAPVQPATPAAVKPSAPSSAAPAARTAPVGAILGKAANGGDMIQGYNGVKNSITQANRAARQGMQVNADGTWSLMPVYGNGGGGDGPAQSLSESGGGGGAYLGLNGGATTGGGGIDPALGHLFGIDAPPQSGQGSANSKGKLGPSSGKPTGPQTQGPLVAMSPGGARSGAMVMPSGKQPAAPDAPARIALNVRDNRLPASGTSASAGLAAAIRRKRG
jgi:hypothetical protein